MNEKQSKDIGPDGFLETNKPHRKWYDIETGMGKQRGKPKAVPPKVKKKKGDGPHHIRKHS